MKTCTLCNSNVIVHRFDVGDYPLWHCKGCGFEWLHPQPDDAVLGEIYSAQYHQNRIAGGNIHTEMKTKVFSGSVEKAMLPPAATVLDVGCAEGDLLALLHKAGHHVYGIEYASFAANLCVQKFGKDNIHCGVLEDIPFSAVSFDAVFLMDVLEHVRDPLTTLREVHRRLKPDGILVLHLPNVASLSRRLMYKAWPHYLMEHLFYFSPATIAAALHQTGFQKTLQSSFKKPLSIFYLATVLSGKKERAIYGFFLTLKTILKMLPKALTHKMFYLPCGEMLVIAKKNSGKNLPS
ncbi:MAG: class I SAM-dependent methyltransferase [Alphaproteobacteria bacterium]